MQADIKTISAMGAHGCSVITALTAQNTKQVESITPVNPATVSQQIASLRCDLPPQAIKTGMLFDASIVEAAASVISAVDCPVVCDPVLFATSGDSLHRSDFINALKKKLLPLVQMVTPNLDEALVLADREPGGAAREISNRQYDELIESLSIKILALGPRSVLIKGGHRGGWFSQDFWTDGAEKMWLTSRRISGGDTHGSGCTLSSAIATALASGCTTGDALVIGKAFVTRSIQSAIAVGGGSAPVVQSSADFSQSHLPWVTTTSTQGRLRPQFPSCGPEPLGFYPIVDRARWLSQLLPAGVTTVQLRVKDLTGSELEDEIRSAIHVAREFDCRLFVNDYWELAIQLGAYGVHLGQQDLLDADLDRLSRCRLRLGVSTHSFEEVSRALSVRPSYIAFGPIFPTETKLMQFPPQGIEKLKVWRERLQCPLVCIGGITLEQAQELIDTGVDGIAVVRDITCSANAAARAGEWVRLCSAMK